MYGIPYIRSKILQRNKNYIQLCFQLVQHLLLQLLWPALVVALLTAFQNYCFGSHKRGRSRGHEDIPVSGIMHVQMQAVGAHPNICGPPDLKETADVGDPDSNVLGKGEQSSSHAVRT